MVHGDALITEKLQQASSEDLLSEVQGSLDQLSAFSPSRKASSKSVDARRQAVPSPSMGLRNLEDIKSPDAVPERLLLSAVRRRKQTVAHLPQSSVDGSANRTADRTLEAFPQIFQSPNLPGMQQSDCNEKQLMSSDHPSPAQVWAGMQPELLSQVLQQVQWTSREAIALTGVCRCSIANVSVLAFFC